jgi:hypothetical protein
MPIKLDRAVFAIFLVITLISCKKEQSLAEMPRGAITDFEEVGFLTRDQIIDGTEETDATLIANHDVRYFVVNYRSDYMGEPVNTRGLLLVPTDVDTMILINYTHGTLIPLGINLIEKQLPSNFRGQTDGFYELNNLCLPMASNGFAVFMPDYIGFSNSDNKEHPYVYYPELFKCIIDGIRAAKQSIANLNFAQDNRVFLTGWSQGAGACVSAHKYIERDYSNEFEVVASSGLAGPYNSTEFINFVFQNQEDTYKYLNIYSWAVYSINKFSGIKRPTDQLFIYPVYDQISAILVPSKKPENVFNMFFMNRIVNGLDTEMVNAIANNSYHNNWVPQSKVFLHHGDADEIVPYFNSLDAYNELTALGGDVTLYTYPDGSHSSEVNNYLTNTVIDFNLLK